MPDKPLVCVDPGHGGRFTGAEGARFLEKDLTLRLALSVREAASNEVDTILTREKDEDLSGGAVDNKAALYRDLAERCRMCNEADADLFISLHYNSFHLPSARGFEVLHWHTSSNGKRLAELISERFDSVGGKFSIRNRGMKPRKNLYVLSHTRPPAVIVEAGFISNPKEEVIVAAPDYQGALSNALHDALQAYFG